jgi:CBS domain-containing protein
MRRRIIPDVLRERKMVSVLEQTTVREAAKLMREHDVGAVPIIEDEVLKGILTVNDVTYRVVAEGLDLDETIVREVMTPEPDTIKSDAMAVEALRHMQDGGYRHLPVVEDGRVLGVVSRRDFYGAEKARLDDETAMWERIA